MKPLKLGDSGQEVKRLQVFLKQEGLHPGEADGDFGPKTKAAVLNFKQQHGIPAEGEAEGEVDATTQRLLAGERFRVACKKAYAPHLLAPLQRRWFELGPHQQGDVRLLRPYFLVPMDPDYAVERTGLVRGPLREWVEAGPGITDVFVLSHGWHRNFAGAVAAYDRLAGRIAALLGRPRLRPKKLFQPLFLNLHWHSDPGEDEWVDRSGRRRKEAFMLNASRTFEIRAPLPPEAAPPNFANDFEDLFELFSVMSAPGKDALSDRELEELAADVSQRLLTYRVRSTAPADPARPPTAFEVASERAHVAAAAWCCYHEAHPQRVLLDQDLSPGRFIGTIQAIRTFATFVLGAAGIGVILSVMNLPIGGTTLVRTIGNGLQVLLNQMEKYPILGTVAGGILVLADVIRGEPVAALFGAGLLGIPYLALAALWVQWRRTEEPSAGMTPGNPFGLVLWLAWALAQVVCALPLALGSVITYFFGGIFRVRPGLFDERVSKRDQKFPPPGPGGPEANARPRQPWWARSARMPAYLMLASLPPDDGSRGIVETVDCQLAFWQMQHAGVVTGDRAGLFLAEVVREIPALAGANFHFVGHSFGSLVVANALRRLALDDACAEVRVGSVCWLQGALASNWLENEPRVRQRVTGSIACVYSRYDTANAFYYPAGNQGRLSAGYVGLYGGEDSAGDKFHPEPRGRYAALVRPPHLPPALGAPPRIINLDASRIVYEGPVATGGGHGDIFKDDVIHLVWAGLGLADEIEGHEDHDP